MIDLDDWQELGEVLSASPLRTLLTMAGVFWGTFVLVVMLGFARGLEVATERAVSGMATNAVFVWGGRTRLPYQGFQPGRWIGFDDDDIPALRELEGVRVLAPRNQLGGYRDGTPVTRGEHTGAFQVSGDFPEIASIETFVFDQGRFVNALDLEESRKVAVIGEQVWTTLFPDGDDPLGHHVLIRGIPFQVIGRFHSLRGDDEGDRAEQSIHVPFTTFQRAFNARNEVQWFAVLGEEDVSGTALEAEVKRVLMERHDIHPDDDDALGSFNAEREFGRIRSLFRGIRGLTWLVGTATLLSGAIGVSNVLLIVVRERTKEIGVRRAIGATPGSVVRMIVREAVVMTGVAGLSGLVVGIGLCELVALAIGPDNPSFGPPRVDPRAAVAAAVLLVLSGLVAGFLPARRAVAIQPVEALRAE